MKTQAVVLLAASLIVTTFVAEIECFAGGIPRTNPWNGKRELRGKVETLLPCYTCSLAILGCILSFLILLIFFHHFNSLSVFDGSTFL